MLASGRVRAPGSWAQSCAQVLSTASVPIRGAKGQEGGQEQLKLLLLLAEMRVALFYQRC